jgi:hypothetical protein
MDAVRAGRKDLFEAVDEHNLARALWKYFCAARDGTARQNLRLLARSLVGLADATETFADEFDRYAPVLARLRPDQIVSLVKTQTTYEAFLKRSDENHSDAYVLEGARRTAEVVAVIFPEQAGISGDDVSWELASMGLLAPTPAEKGMVFIPTAFARSMIQYAALEAEISGKQQPEG